MLPEKIHLELHQSQLIQRRADWSSFVGNEKNLPQFGIHPVHAYTEMYIHFG